MEDLRKKFSRLDEILTADIVITPPVTNEPVQIVNNSVVNSREGKKVISGHFYPAMSKQLKLMAVEYDSTVQELLEEAINDLFEKYDKPRIVTMNN